MSVLKYFKNIPRSPSHRATGPKCNFFFFKFATKSLEKKKGPVARWGGDRGLSPTPRATGACRPLGGRQGLFFPGTYFELFKRVVVIIVGRISAANSYRTELVLHSITEKKSQELPLFHEHYGTHKHNKFTSIVPLIKLNYSPLLKLLILKYVVLKYNNI